MRRWRPHADPPMRLPLARHGSLVIGLDLGDVTDPEPDHAQVITVAPDTTGQLAIESPPA